MLKIPLYPLLLIHAILVKLRNFLFDIGVFKVSRLKTPVIGVGNLTMGGTGKTPFVNWLLTEYEKRGLKVGVVCRGYRGEFVEIQQVDLEREGAPQFFGDEPTLLAEKHREVPVFVGRHKAKTAIELERVKTPDLILVDDAFQHRALFRKLDAVILDATVPLSDYKLFPVGKGREGFSALNRAQILILNKVNLTDQSRTEALLARVQGAGQFVEGENLFCFAYQLKGFRHMKTGQRVKSEDFPQREVTALCGIGQPESFVKTLQTEAGLNVTKRAFFRDHHHYQREELMAIEGDVICMTEKDAVKVQRLHTDERFWVAELEITPQSPLNSLYVQLDQLVGTVL